MAIRKITLDYIHEMMSEFKLKNLKMCELGNQKIADDCVNFKIAKDYFKSLGIFHTSIDLNGEDGAIPLDFNKPINIGKFDVVTNIGFSEHIKDQEQCFNNIDNLAKLFQE